MAGCDAAMHPSRGEAMSLAVLEYMCGGLPPVVPSLPSVSVAVEHGVTGLIYKNLDVDSAVSAPARWLMTMPCARDWDPPRTPRCSAHTPSNRPCGSSMSRLRFGRSAYSVASNTTEYV